MYTCCCCGCLVAKSCLILFDSTEYITPGFPVLHYLPEFAQTHVCCVDDTIQPFYLLLPPSPPALNLPVIKVPFNESALHIRWPKYWSFSFSISPSQ